MADKNEKKKIMFKGNSRRLIVAAVVIILCAVATVVFIKSMQQKKIDIEEYSQLSSALEADKKEISTIEEVDDENGKAYKEYMESQAQEQGYGKPDETINYDEGYGD